MTVLFDIVPNVTANKAFFGLVFVLPVAVSVGLFLGSREAISLLLGFAVSPVIARVRKLFLQWRLGKLAAEFLADLAVPLKVTQDLSKQKPRVVQVTAQVHVALNFGLANSVLIVGKNGCIVVDTMESYQAAKDVYREFRKITKLPLKTIIITHCHQDHCHGTNAFIEEELEPPEIWAHATIQNAYRSQSTMPRSCLARRSARQFGFYLPDEHMHSCGIGPRLRYRELCKDSKVVRPSHFVEKDVEEHVFAGVRVVLMHIPGESNDQMGVWLPDTSVMLPADDVYKSFPNLYTIRGDPPRDTMEWVASLDKIRAVQPTHLVPSHTEPVSGRSKVLDILTVYRDAIQYVHDQTVRRMTEGLDIDDIVKAVELPKSMRDHPYLREYYGTVEWSVRSVFYQKVGWLNQSPRELFPLHRTERANLFKRHAGGTKAMGRVAREYYGEGRYKECIEIADSLLAINPSDESARDLYCHAIKRKLTDRFKKLANMTLTSRKQLELLAGKQTSMNARNYLLTCALETKGLADSNLTLRQFRANVMSLSELECLTYLSCMISPEALDGETLIFNYIVTDDNSCYHGVVRNYVWTAHQGISNDAHATVRTTRKAWRNTMTKSGFLLASFARGEVQVEGNAKMYLQFMANALASPVVWNQLAD